MTRARDVGLITTDQHVRLSKQISARGWRRSEPGHVPLERPTVLTEALRIQREIHGYSDAELADLAGLSQERLADLMPDHFESPSGRRPSLSVVR